MKLVLIPVTVAVFSILTACGGGSDGATTPTQKDVANFSTGTVNTTTTTSLPVSIVTSVVTPTYAQNSKELEVFELLNKERFSCGFGYYAQNQKLDISTLGHAKWLVNNNYSGHYQASGTPGFTGVSLLDRVTSAGYDLAVAFSTNSQIIFAGSEVISGQFNSKADESYGVGLLYNLFNAPYHLFGLIRGYKDVGIGLFANPPNRNNILSYVTLVIDIGSSVNNVMQNPNSGSIRTYPCEGTTGVGIKMGGEDPSPVQNRDFTVNPIGSSVAVMIDIGHVLKITSASMINVSDGSNVAILSPVIGSADVNNRLWANEGFIMADKPMQPNTKYQVTINGTDNGKAFSRTFTFTTGTGG